MRKNRDEEPDCDKKEILMGDAIPGICYLGALIVILVIFAKAWGNHRARVAREEQREEDLAPLRAMVMMALEDDD